MGTSGAFGGGKGISRYELAVDAVHNRFAVTGDLYRGGRLAPILTIKAKAHGHKGGDGLFRPVTVNSLTCKFNLQVYLFVGIMELLCREKPSTPP